MKALMYEGPNTLRVVDRPKPEPGRGEVLVKVRACGICGSDVHGYLGITGRRTPPMVMGHEFSGRVEALGEGAARFAPGDRVAVQPALYCGTCAHCRSGRANLCPDKQIYGVFRFHGAFQEYLCIPEGQLFALPEQISYEEGALIEALAVSRCAVKKAGELGGKTVVIVGGGTIGQLALLAAKSGNPACLVLTDLNESRRAAALRLGADYALDPGAEDLPRFLEARLGRLADVSVEAVGSPGAVRQALEVLRPGGRSVWAGNSAKRVEVDMHAVVTRELQIAGSYTYTHREFGEAVEFMAACGLDFSPLITRVIPVEEAPAMFAALAKDPGNELKVVVAFQ